ncbi:MAG: malate synthase A [Gemmatimonadales bacterium]
MATSLMLHRSPLNDEELCGPSIPRCHEVLTAEALDFVAALTRALRPRIDDALGARLRRRSRLAAGERLDFLPDTRSIREGDWRVAPVPRDLERRIVEITGPVDRKMIINALNSGADVFMADFEDATTPTWANLVNGQVNLLDAVRGTIEFQDPETAKAYRLGERVATLMVRPRGLHLPEGHYMVDGRPVPGALFDFGLFVFHNARELLDRGTAPYFYLPKLESHREARIWDQAFGFAEEQLELPVGTIKATVLIETLPAAFEMHEILWELREHSAGLNCGRWDYIFSYIKTNAHDPAAVLPDRGQVTMLQPFLRTYTQLVVQTCHRRGAHAIGGMAAQIPIRDDPGANAAALEAVRADKRREVGDGHDGTWVAHPALVAVAREVFEAGLEGPNQLGVLRQDHLATAADLLRVPEGTRTEAGLRHNVRVGVQYLEAWLRGVGCVPIENLMEDAATAEISRTQVWQWIRHRAALDDGRKVTAAMLRAVMAEELAPLRRATRAQGGPARRWDEATALFERFAIAPECAEFLTLATYDQVLAVDTGEIR